MSIARKCDLCGEFFSPSKHRTITLDVHVCTDEVEDQFDTWADVDLCKRCTAIVLAVIRPALVDFPKE